MTTVRKTLCEEINVVLHGHVVSPSSIQLWSIKVVFTWTLCVYNNNNKTGTCQCTRAVWSTFAEIHSNHPGALMHYLGLLEFPVRMCNSHITTHTWLRSLKTPGLPITFSVCRSFEVKDYWTFSHCFHMISFCSRVYMSRNALLTSRSTWARRV